MTTQPIVNVEIIDGPNTDNLMRAFRHSFSAPQLYAERIPVFRLKYDDSKLEDFPARITGLEYEAEAEGKFLVRMRIGAGSYIASYDTSTQKGIIRTRTDEAY